MMNNRRPYINRQLDDKQQDSAPGNISQNVDTDSLKQLIVDSLKHLSGNVDELKKSVKALEERLEYIDTRLSRNEDRVNRYDSRYNSDNTDLSGIRNEIEALRREKESLKQYEDAETDNRPVMPGTGFAGITPEYLRNLSKR